MAGNIVTANVGGSAGGVVIPEAQDASYATWPSILDKTLTDITAIMLANANKTKQAAPGNSPSPGPIVSGGAAPTFSAFFNRDTFIIMAVIVVLIVGAVFLRR